MANPHLDKAKNSKNDEFYTQYPDIEKEVNAYVEYNPDVFRDKTRDGRIDIDDLDWQYIKGDGDFRGEEVKKLRDEADVIITNPPFSLFREFLAWIIEAKKEFMIIGNMNAI